MNPHYETCLRMAKNRDYMGNIHIKKVHIYEFFRYKRSTFL